MYDYRMTKIDDCLGSVIPLEADICHSINFVIILSHIVLFSVVQVSFLLIESRGRRPVGIFTANDSFKARTNDRHTHIHII